MNRRGRSRFGGSPEIYYYNSARRDAVGELAGQLSGLIQEEMTRRHKRNWFSSASERIARPETVWDR
ncbi:MAG: hypothetical protein ACLR8P_04700 [Clostridium fessum]